MTPTEQAAKAAGLDASPRSLRDEWDAADAAHPGAWQIGPTEGDDEPPVRLPAHGQRPDPTPVAAHAATWELPEDEERDRHDEAAAARLTRREQG